MAFSSSEGKLLFKDWLIHIAKPLGFKRFLDVGCGAGLYGDLIREVFQGEATIHAMEIFVEYIGRYSLSNKYDSIFMDDIRKTYFVVENYDFIVAGDVLEHLSKEDAIEVVNGLRKKCKFLFGALPVKVNRPWSIGYNQLESEWQENPYNQHLHNWTGEEIHEAFKPLWLVPFIQTGAFLVEGSIQC